MRSRNKIIIILTILGLAYVNQFVFRDGFKGKSDVNNENEKPVIEASAGKSEGKALIGGDFELTDQNGKKFNSDQLKGKKSIIYFGFTNCPMICPTALSTLTLVMNEIDPDAEKFTPIFITTDPERDTPERLNEYLAAFHEKTIGLTGSQEDLEKAYKGYKVYAKKVDTGTENYDMNHSSIIYVMDEKGEYISHFSHESKVEDIIKKLESL